MSLRYSAPNRRPRMGRTPQPKQRGALRPNIRDDFQERPPAEEFLKELSALEPADNGDSLDP